MKETRDIAEFVKVNHQEIIKFVKWKTKIDNPVILEDITQNFYLVLCREKILDRFDRSKGTFESWVLTCLCRRFEKEKPFIAPPEIEGVLQEDELVEKIKDFQRYIRIHCNGRTQEMLDILKDRIKGTYTWRGWPSEVFNDLVKDFLREYKQGI
jgi:hypothetical protein